MFDRSGSADNHEQVGAEGRRGMKVAEVDEGEVIQTDLDGEVL